MNSRCYAVVDPWFLETEMARICHAEGIYVCDGWDSRVQGR